MTAGFLGSSSGMPASTFPTKSAPTSAPFVKIPPPSLAKIEINDAPNPRATNALTISSLSFQALFPQTIPQTKHPFPRCDPDHSRP